MKLKITLLLFLFSIGAFFSQNNEKFNFKQAAVNGNLNYFEIVEKKLSEIKNYDLSILSNKKESKHFYRWASFWKDRVSENGLFPDEKQGYFNAGILDAKGKIIQNSFQNKLSNENWTNVGPQVLPDENGYPNPPQMGRLNCFLRIQHPSDRNQDVLFVGAPNGGVWKSTNGGTSWSPKLDMVAGIGVTDIKTTPDATFANYATKPIYVSTGDYDGQHVSSIGVLKSTDGGETFSSTGLSYNESQGEILGELIVADENTVLVGAKDFIKITVDGGTTWTNIYQANIPGEYIWKLQILDNNPNAMFGALYASNPNPGKLIKSLDGGANWTTYNAPESAVEAVGFVSETKGWMGGHTTGFYETTDGGATWTNLSIGGNLNRIFVINNSVAYAAGATVYKYTTQTLNTSNTEIYRRRFSGRNCKL